MKIVGNINKISDKLKATIKPLKPNETITYQALWGVQNADPDEKERSRNPILYGKKQVPTNGRIYDPYVKDMEGNEVGGWVDIGAIDFNDDKGNVTYKFFYPGMGHNIFMGKWSLSGSKQEDVELYEFFSLCDENESNHKRNKSIPALFKVVNAITDSKETTGKVATLRKAINLSGNITESEGRDLAASLNWKVFHDWDVLKAEIETFASRNPEKFIAVYDDPNTKVKATIKHALDREILKYDIVKGEVTMAGNLITTIKKTEDLLESLFSWQQSAKNGEQVLASIEKQLSKKKEEVPA